MVTLVVLVEVVVVHEKGVKYSSFEAHPLLLDFRRQMEVVETPKAKGKPNRSRHTRWWQIKRKRKRHEGDRDYYHKNVV